MANTSRAAAVIARTVNVLTIGASQSGCRSHMPHSVRRRDRGSYTPNGYVCRPRLPVTGDDRRGTE